MGTELYEMGWYCLSARPKQENKVALILQKEIGIEVFSPRIRFRRLRYGLPLWITEALFPGYVFAHFCFADLHRQVRAVSGVSGIVTFGDRPSVLGESLIAELRAATGDKATVQIDSVPEAGSDVIIASGSLAGLRAVVTRVLPARRRVAILFEMLGQQREVEIEMDRVLLPQPRRTFQF